MRPWLRVVGGGVALIVAALLMAALASSWFASAKVRAARDRWDRAVGGPASILERYPSRGDNAQALALEPLVGRLGIELAPRDTDRRFVEAEVGAHYRELRHAIAKTVDRHLSRKRRKVTPPEPELIAWFRSHEATLTEIKRQLLDDGTPYWRSDLSLGVMAPMANLLGQLNLQRVLLAEAIWHLAEGRSERALEGFEASWVLNGSLRDNGMLIERMIALFAYRLKVGLLRQFDDVPERWRERLRTEDYRTRFYDSLYIDGWMSSRVFDVVAEDDRPRWLRALGSLGEPAIVYGHAYAYDRHLRQLDEVAERSPRCDATLADVGVDAELDIPEWLEPLIVHEPILADMGRLQRLEVEIELTRHVLGDLEPGPSLACPEESWSAEPGPDGRTEIRLSRELDWGDLPRPEIAALFRL